MGIISLTNSIKYRIIRLIESNPSLNLLIYNNITFFKPFLPHEKDYHGIKHLIKNKLNDTIIDIGGNLGISAMGFRKLGFKNKIFLFEPNKYIYNNYIKKKLLKNYKNIFGYNFALGHKNQTREFFYPYYKDKCIHYFCSFDKSYVTNSINITFKNKKIKIIKDNLKIRSFDKLNIRCNPKLLKIDVEGYDYEVIKGMKNTIRNYKPVILVEFNKNNFYKIKRFLKNYDPWVYFFEKNKFQRFNNKMIDRDIARTIDTNLMSVRNIFFIPKLHKWI